MTYVFLAGLAAMTGFLGLVGITRSRGMSVRGWTAVWTSSSAAFALFLLAAFVTGDPLATEAALGASVGYAASVAFHTLHHFRQTQAGREFAGRIA